MTRPIIPRFKKLNLQANLPPVQLPPEPTVLKAQSLMAKQSLNKIITGTAMEVDWFNLYKRVAVGNLAAYYYYQYTTPIEEIFTSAFECLKAIRIHQLLGGKWEMMVYERIDLVTALDFTDELIRPMTLRDNLDIHRAMESYFADIEIKNSALDPQHAARQAMFDALMARPK